MATIRPFMALRPQEVYVDRMLSLRSSAGSGKCNGSLAQKLDKGQDGNQELTNDHIIGNLTKMISAGDFYQEEHPCIFIYEITEGSTIQTGVWAVTDLDDFENGHIKTHESTLESNSSGLINYRDEVGLEGGPLLITHRPTAAIRAILLRIKQAEANSVYYSNKVFHRIWTVYDMKTIQQLSACFSELQHVYLADGHHRLAAAVNYRKTKQMLDSKSTDFNYISSFYLASDQLKIKEYHRVIIPSDEIYIDQVFRDLKKSFSVTKSQRNEMVIPMKKHEFGLFIAGRWYNMTCKLKDATELPDACLLQEMVFKPFFNIENPGTDQRLIPVGGAGAVLELERILLENPHAIAFTMAAMNAEQLIEIAQQGIMLPPKSTWIEPKIPFGLLLRKLKKVSC
ncbi:DUF1015 family protein [Pedobacter hartonius]|uniref:Uncharacterized conserved protein, DUF1015 family n=1 Tax=Pedobacter hartonius TaxID=425514 RepID=A0A1H4DYM4_9SPHI|nr:DUF1015 family protein [Pedobacter hartonius]SEA77905.1 Uncharacterized conserved protein, DUF1015 family [Pedobacter hartonius]